MAMMFAAQQEVIATLYEIGDTDLADRLERCMTARRERRGGDGWPFTCRSAAYVWCRRPMIRAWWNGMCQWSEAATSSLAIMRIDSSAGLRDGARTVRTVAVSVGGPSRPAPLHGRPYRPVLVHHTVRQGQAFRRVSTFT